MLSHLSHNHVLFPRLQSLLLNLLGKGVLSLLLFRAVNGWEGEGTVLLFIAWHELLGVLHDQPALPVVASAMLAFFVFASIIIFGVLCDVLTA